ncbi:unnamed protein product [Heterobilharzia americana]|nr:unnamed protein product [Heterobilharzia americana]
MGGEITQPATNGVSQGPSANSKNAIDGTNHLMASPANDNLNSENEVASNSDGLPISQKSSDLLSKHFQIKRWDACACWSWDVVHDTCVICRNVLMSLCKLLVFVVIISCIYARLIVTDYYKGKIDYVQGSESNWRVIT